MNLGEIEWAKDPIEATKQYLSLVVEVIEWTGLEFEGAEPQPLAIAKAYVAGAMEPIEYAAFAGPWWDYLERTDQLREFGNREAVKARLALCLLTVRPEESVRLEDHLSWFFQFLQKLGFSLDVPRAMMEQRFGQL
jgi:hypothetical protein